MIVQSKLQSSISYLTQRFKDTKVVTSGVIIAIVIHNLVVFQRIRRVAAESRLDLEGKSIQVPKSVYSSSSILNKLSLQFLNSYKCGIGGNIGVNDDFFKQLSSIFKVIMCDGKQYSYKVILILMLHTTFLLLRTYLSVVVARVSGLIVKNMVAREPLKFLRYMGYFFVVGVPATYTNSLIKYLQSKLAVQFRTKLTDYANHLYLDECQTYYSLLHLDREVVGADQYLTSDIDKFSKALAKLYSSLGKPTLDFVFFVYQLSKSIGNSSIAIIIISYLTTVTLLRALSPNFGRLATTETQLEGDFRNTHIRLITNAEEIAFYHGAEVEQNILSRSYSNLIKHTNTILKLRIPYNMCEDFVIKYCWSAIGLCMCAIPVFQPQWSNQLNYNLNISPSIDEKSVAANRTQDFTYNRRLMMSLGDAGSRFMYAYKDLAELAGYTFRVYDLFSTLNRLRKNKLKRINTAVTADLLSHQLESYENGTETDTKLKVVLGLSTDCIKGIRITGNDCINFKKVPIVAPNLNDLKDGEVLIKDLSFKVEFGQHLLINGPNGTGKSAIARVLKGLWPVFSGTVEAPEPKYLFFIPQKPYLSLSNLRDQIIYPHTEADMVRLGLTDADLVPILKAVHLTAIPDREGGLDTIKEWKDVFSGGEKQRVNLARLFYHKPKFAILDECTSAVSSDVEGLMYYHAKELGITLITISHRPALFKYHDYLLTIVGEDGKFEIQPISDKNKVQQTVKKEIEELKEKLINVQRWKSRLTEVNRLLDV